MSNPTADGSTKKPTGRVTRDRFARKNPFHIAKRMPADDQSPSGWQLGWKSPRQRNGSGTGWGQWERLEYGMACVGKNGEKLKDFIPDPPMMEPGAVDNFVRRADTILCRIPADVFDENQNAAAEESQMRVEELTVDEGVPLARHVTTLGQGRKRDSNPIVR